MRIYECESEEDFERAENFLKTNEKFYAALMELVLEKSENVHLICSDEKVAGVLSYTKGKSLSCCIDKWSKKTRIIMEDFIINHDLFCVTGKKSDVEHIVKMMKKHRRILPSDVREMLLMETNQEQFRLQVPSLESETIVCDSSKAEDLIHLKLGFAEEEVLPKWKNLIPAAERFNLEKLLKNQIVVASRIEANENRSYVSMAHTIARTQRFWLIGGVYTSAGFRSKGFASSNVSFLARKAMAEKRTPVLFVKRKNKAAIKCYEKCGFFVCGKYETVYYEI